MTPSKHGVGWGARPWLALVVSSVLPLLLLPAALFVMDRRNVSSPADPAVSGDWTRAEAPPERVCDGIPEPLRHEGPRILVQNKAGAPTGS
jgi:hypothetical protein